MSSEFYTSIIEEERKTSGITREKLKIAVRVIGSSYSKDSLKNGSTHLNYNNPEYRCAYLYKYANLHTSMVTKYFRKFIRKKEVRNNFKKDIKICSLGGGPGTDIIGIFKALAVMPHFHQRISQVSVLDICSGWRNTFENIISGVLKGKVSLIPETFINSQRFKHELIGIDLLQTLPRNAEEIISNAEIICMVKFISVILARDGCLDALKVLGKLFKPGAVVLFIDNYIGEVFESIKDVFEETGLEVVLGPSLEVYVRHTSQKNEETYGCLPQTAAKISVVGLIKKVKTIPKIFYSLGNVSYSSESTQEDFICSSNCLDDNTESCVNTNCDKFVQTELEDSKNLCEDYMQEASLQCEEELPMLMGALLDLLEAMQKIKNNRRSKHLCCHCY